MKGWRAILLATAALACIGPAQATVNTSASEQNIIATGQQTQFSFGFVGVSPAYITVIYTDASGNQSVLSQGSGPTQYQITLNPAPPGATWGVGGTVTYAPNGGPIAPGTTLTIARTLPLVQAISLQAQASYGQVGKSAEKASDLLEMELQQVYAATQRSIQANITNSSLPKALPPAAQAAGQGVCFDASGSSLIACQTIPSTTASSAILPFLAAASISDARSVLGLGTLANYNVGAGLQDDGAGNIRSSSALIPDSTNTPVTASFFKQAHTAFGPLTYTFPAGSTLWNGFGFWVYAFGPVTLTPASNDNFATFASGQSITLESNSSAYIVTNGSANATWFVQKSGSPQTQVHFAGETIKMRGPICPYGTVPEDGRTLSRSSNSALFAAIGTAWGAGDGSTTFNVPDARGVFDRNLSSGSANDPGRVLGTFQADQLQQFIVTYQQSVNTNYSNQAGGGVPNTNQGVNPATATLSGANFGSETRPKNIAALSCIWTGELQ